jgi:hypothetical protein
MPNPVVKPSWREKLPSDCPPKGAGPLAAQELIRLASSKQYCDDDFKSHAALGKPCQNGKLCEWSSCSMFLPSVTKAQLDDLRKYPNLRTKKIVLYVKVDQQSGEGVISKAKHVDFWMYQSYNPIKHVTKWLAVDDYK